MAISFPQPGLRMLFIGSIRFAIMVALLLSTPAWAQTATGLSLDEAVRIALARSRSVEATASQGNAAREMAIAAAQLPDPVLKLGVNNLPINGPDRFSTTRDFMTMRSIGVMQEFTREEKRHARRERFEREAALFDANRDAVAANVQRDTALAWLERFYQESLRTFLLAQTREAQLQIDAAETAYRSGRGSQADVFAAHSQREHIQDRLSIIDRQITVARTQLARWVGDAAHQTLAGQPRLDRVPLSAGELEAQLAHHPQLAVANRQEALADAEVRMAHANRKPDWTWEVMFSQRGEAYSNMVSVNVSIPLQWGRANRQDRELAAKLALVDQAKAQREETLRMHLADTQAMLQEWENNRERLARFDRALLPLAQQRTQAALTAYRAGSGTLATVLEARRSEIDTQIERVRLDMDTVRLWAQLTYLIPVDHVPVKTVSGEIK